ncbi:site-2 protease family protein [Candidatus Minimicrobia naudis]|uniref:Site-2 protease family protein n=1 Tax=Candidatus Minimicrobia naudis TaxID=2841263 RepID=A0A8F1MBP0_9BACT|nr:site-2 protease family protein [Candidatus Minimicrobia naudis]
MASVSGSVAGPIGILGVLFPSVVSSGIEYIIFVAALISLTLAVMNILPIPALDGGRWFTMTDFPSNLRKDLTKEREENIQATGMLILLILTILVTISDVGKLF